MTYLPEKTIRYKTFIKTSVVEALRPVFENHVDEMQRRTKITIDFPKTQAQFPAVIVRFFGRGINNAGVGHTERLADKNDPPNHFKYKHYFWSGDLEFAVYALTSLDRDLISDTLVQIVAMGDLESYTNLFFRRIYADERYYPDAETNFIAVNSDQIQDFGESQTQTPWQAEDDLVYQVSYRVSASGEFYSLPHGPHGFVEKVTPYSWIKDFEEEPTGDPNDGADWEPFPVQLEDDHI